jgi:2-polyprenyl-3-methyl-5-hydroxy-6-metoxy-1,4-benzoquinol methylase
MKNSVTTDEKPWLLGEIEEGWEWFAFTFKDQEQIKLTPKEIEKMLQASDQVTLRAYSRMLMERETHRWAQFAEEEADFLTKIFDTEKVTSVLDFGCGTGRHALPLAKRRFRVSGVDYVDKFVLEAKSKSENMNLENVEFYNGDCRTFSLSQEFDAAICLYDVIGTYTDYESNMKILKNLFQHVKKEGLLFLSVMNYALTERNAKYFFSIKEEPDKLLELKPSQTMEKTGDVFDPEYYMIDKNTKIVYRKEQFAEGNSLPTELIVRDKRFTVDEISDMCREVGLDVVWARCVRAGRWYKDLGPDHSSSKEILIYCKKP